MEWNWLLSQSKLQELGVDAILNRYLIIALQQYPSPGAALERVKSVCLIFSLIYINRTLHRATLGSGPVPLRIKFFCLIIGAEYFLFFMLR